MTHYTYVIRKDSTGEYYIGFRSCVGSPHEDPYMGSSKVVKARLHEGDWFKYIIQQYPSRKVAMRDEPRQIKGHLNNGLCLNLSAGGGNWQKLSVEARARQSSSLKATLALPQHRAKKRAIGLALGKDPAVRAKRSASQLRLSKDPRMIAVRKAAQKKSWSDEELKARRIAVMHAGQNRPEVSARCSAIQKKIWADPVVRAKRLRKMRRALNKPEVRAKLGAAVSASWAWRARATCPHCAKEGTIGLMKRWHFDNCKRVANAH